MSDALREAYRRGYEDRANERDYDPGRALDLVAPMPAEVEEALEWLTKVHDSDPSARRLATLRAALIAADAQRQEAVSFAEHWRSAATRTALAGLAAPEAGGGAMSEEVQYDDGSWSREMVPALTLTDFLLARIAEDDATVDRRFDGIGDPSRVLVECEAKRRIVEIVSLDGIPDHLYQAALQALALPYAAHPDYREEWKR